MCPLAMEGAVQRLLRHWLCLMLRRAMKRHREAQRRPERHREAISGTDGFESQTVSATGSGPREALMGLGGPTDSEKPQRSVFCGRSGPFQAQTVASGCLSG